MGLFKSIKDAKKSMSDAMAMGTALSAQGELSPEERARFTPEQLDIIEAQRAVAAEQAAERAAHEPLLGPAGAMSQSATPGAVSFGGDSAGAPPPRAELGPQEWEQQVLAERAARDAARAPFLAPERQPVGFTRFVVDKKAKHSEIAAALAQTGLTHQPAQVYGISRVPDYIDKGNVVEWQVVHAAGPTPGAPPPAVVAFDADGRWVARAPGQPSVLDEDLGVAYLNAAGVPPHQCLGVARDMSMKFHSGGDDRTASQEGWVNGVVVFHAPHYPTTAFDTMGKQRPLPLPLGGETGFHVEVLNWRAIAQVVHPKPHDFALVPSPFAYLPSTAEELLQSYLEVVGVLPSDCVSAQVTEDTGRNLLSRLTAQRAYTIRGGGGTEAPCADGTVRRRCFGGSYVVIAYQDRAEYAVGRERWAAYERDVMQSQLAKKTGARRPVETPDSKLMRRTEKLFSIADAVTDGFGDNRHKAQPHRYCWPPQ